MRQYHPTDSRLWLRNQLYAEAFELADASPERGRIIRSIYLSELEALAMLLVSFEAEATLSSETYMPDIARHLTSILLSRLEATL